MIFHPLPCIHEGFYPRSDLVGLAVGRIVGLLPREDGTFQVWHHGEMATISRCDACHVVVGTVGVARIARVVVFCYDMVVLLCLWKTEVAFSVCHPETEFAAAEGAEHY